MAAANNNFGIALRGWRERLSPAAGGLASVSATDRRIPGLRREELARLAGVSVDYVVRLEQGRARNPSAQVAIALSRALHLDSSERDHLFRCANLSPPSSGDIPLQIPPSVHRLVKQLGDIPVAVYAADWTLVGWNRMWTATIGDPRTYGWDRRNLVAGMFRSDGGHRVDSIAAWPIRSWAGDEAEEEALVADLRVTAAAYPDDAHLTLLVDKLLHTNSRFAHLWSNGTVGPHTGDRKTIEHPVVGDLNLDLDVLMVPGAELRIVTYTAVEETDDAENLDALRTTCHE